MSVPPKSKNKNLLEDLEKASASRPISSRCAMAKDASSSTATWRWTVSMSSRISCVHRPLGRLFTYGRSRSNLSLFSTASMLRAVSNAAATLGTSNGFTFTAPDMSVEVAENSEASMTPGRPFRARARAYSDGYNVWPSRMAVPTSTSLRWKRAKRSAMPNLPEGRSINTTLPGFCAFNLCPSALISSNVRASSCTRVPSNRQYCTNATRPLHRGYSARNRS
mmetsp:Transcript_17942/g.51112  ORF Transcript_17942/g.51112 Transcript_17942/m.51112 type:complete len:222 (+) Transcript_17942:774-1439(+)